jgi:glycosyltransferase involved in cell wall biosynthesis
VNYFRKPDATKLIITGQVTESKKQENAVLAVKELVRRNKNVELIVMENNSTWYIESLKTIVHDENLSTYVTFLGFSENPYSVVNQADIVLVCLRYEVFGWTTLEAMLLKKPVIGTNSGGTVEIIREGFNGLVYQSGNYKQLADKVQYLIENEGSENCENGYNFAKRISRRINMAAG